MRQESVPAVGPFMVWMRHEFHFYFVLRAIPSSLRWLVAHHLRMGKLMGNSNNLFHLYHEHRLSHVWLFISTLICTPQSHFSLYEKKKGFINSISKPLPLSKYLVQNNPQHFTFSRELTLRTYHQCERHLIRVLLNPPPSLYVVWVTSQYRAKYSSGKLARASSSRSEVGNR